MMNGYVFQINQEDNVATALDEIAAKSMVGLRGEFVEEQILAITDIPKGHKMAVRDIAKDEPILKYGVVIGKATKEIQKGEWVHLHCMASVYDTRSSHLDVHTGLPTDIEYK